MSHRSLSTRLAASLSKHIHAHTHTHPARAFTTTPAHRRRDRSTNPASVHMPSLPRRAIKPRSQRAHSPQIPTTPDRSLAYPFTEQPAADTLHETSSDVPEEEYDPRAEAERADDFFNTRRRSPSIEATSFFRITLRRSAIGLPAAATDTLRALGLHKRSSVAFHPVTPATVGAIMRVKELIVLSEVPFAKLPPGADEIVRITHFTDAARSRDAPRLSTAEMKSAVAEVMARYLGAPKFPGGKPVVGEEGEVWVPDAQGLDRHAPPVLGAARLIAKLEEAQRSRERAADVGFWVEKRGGVDALL